MSSEPITSNVSLVIPGRNCASTLRRCLDSVVPRLHAGELAEIIFVDDGSADETSQIASEYPVRVISATGQGPGAARNLGWRAATSDWIWFIDSDCVAHSDALHWLKLRVHESDMQGVGGSYSNLFPESLLARLIHEEIAARHEQMSDEVDFLGGFNVLYRRTALEAARGFDEADVNGPGRPGAEDCDLSFRIIRGGGRLGFEKRSLVGHHHPRSLRRYLRSQFVHGYWRIRLYARHQGKLKGDSYSGGLDHLQPVLATLALASSGLIWSRPGLGLFLASSVATVGCGVPIWRQLHRRRVSGSLYFLPICAIRSVARALGALSGAVSCLLRPPARAETHPLNLPRAPRASSPQPLEIPSS